MLVCHLIAPHVRKISSLTQAGSGDKPSQNEVFRSSIGSSWMLTAFLKMDGDASAPHKTGIRQPYAQAASVLLGQSDLLILVVSQAAGKAFGGYRLARR